MGWREQKAIFQVYCVGTLNCLSFITAYCTSNYPFRLKAGFLMKCSISVIRLLFLRSITLYTFIAQLRYVPLTSATLLHYFNYEEEGSHSFIKKSYH